MAVTPPVLELAICCLEQDTGGYTLKFEENPPENINYSCEIITDDQVHKSAFPFQTKKLMKNQ